MNIISIQPEKRSRWQRFKDYVSMKLLFGRPFFISAFIRWIWYDILKQGGFKSMVIPIIKNIDYSMFMKEIMGVQPMDDRNGITFYMDFKYGKKRKWYQFWKTKYIITLPPDDKVLY